MPVGRMLEGLRQRAAQPIECLVLHKHGVVQTIQHAKGGKSEAAEDQQS
jgi:hypothetical protein